MANIPAVSNGKFSFVADNFFVESSGNHFHPRAPVSDLQAHFQPGNTKDYTAHWYEAQLLHYGLPPSKTKAVAKMRLLDAVNSGKLAVPKEILKIEADLKKEWKKRDKEARAERTQQDGTRSAPKSTPKRKREDVDDAGKPAAKTTKVKREPEAKLTKNETKSTKAAESKSTKAPESKPKKAGVSKSDGTAVTSAPKKQTAKQGGAAVEPKRTTGTADEKPKRTKQTARCSARGGATAVGSRNVKDESIEEKPKRTKQTARCSGRGGAVVARSTNATDATIEEKPKRTKQTARCSSRGGGSISGKRKVTDTSGATLGPTSYNSPGAAPIYSNSEDDEREPYGYEDDMDIDSYSSDNEVAELGQLGLINGVYEIEAPSLEQWEQYGNDFSLILALSGSTVWGEYDFGMFHGILYLPERPFGASYEKIPFTWRGRERSEGEMSFGSSNTGWIRFLGDGNIEGEINCYGHAKFRGYRVSGDETRPPRSAASMQEEWSGYNANEYEHERRARWH